MDDSLGAGIPPRYVTSRLVPLSLLPSMSVTSGNLVRDCVYR